MMRIRPLITAALVALGIYLGIMERDLLVALASGEDGAAATENAAADPLPEAKPVAVQIRTISAAEIQSGIVLRGRTEAFRLVTVQAETLGQIISQPLRKGLLVEEGELLCELDPGTKAAAVAEAEARLAEALTNNDNTQALVRRGVASKTSTKASEAALEAANANLERAKQDLARLQIRAPFDGILESDSAELGSLMQPGAPCATIISLDPIKLVGFATEEQITELTVGAQAGARLVDGRQIIGQVTFLSRSADQDTRTFRVEVTAPNKTLDFRDGATAEILVATAPKEGHLIPQSSLTLNDAGELGVRVALDDTARFMPVSILRDTADGVWVSGLPETVSLIVVGQEFVVDGTPITPVEQEDAS